MFDIHSKVRFINAGDYKISTAEMFLGFLCGTLAQNFDVGLVFIDAFKKLIKMELKDSEWFFTALTEISVKHHVNFVLSVSEDPNCLPMFMNPLLI
jgi:hypothetical protein